ncbi:curlin subunit CsgB [Pseudoalteromonas sp. JBTF-M23]|uniref:Curlin subunit CsgB n=1 Tax=Pseudoalteromonas caenipelagi TaxID=2726988 RepID=A0A849VFJ6_9GAMM|nr:curlin subunit CsgB [Pseudoalteromonas caenipelagi]NOU52499.1 curlin subunit CsgB [Pseudoalteromonas caenipelagi]
MLTKIKAHLASSLNTNVYKRVMLPMSLLMSCVTYAGSADLQESPLSLSINPSLSVHAQLLTTVKQNGTLNKATITQIGDELNLVSLVQLGSNNLAEITQAGANNSVNLIQYGNNNYTSIVQQGDANVVNLTQLGEQTLLIHQLGNEMVLNVSVNK